MEPAQDQQQQQQQHPHLLLLQQQQQQHQGSSSKAAMATPQHASHLQQQPLDSPLLNPDLLERVLLHLDFVELGTSALVGRLWRDVAEGQGMQPVYLSAFWDTFSTQDENHLGRMESAMPGVPAGSVPFNDWRAECRYRRAACQGWTTTARSRKGTYAVCRWCRWR